MSCNWPLVSLAEVTSKIGDGLHGTPKYDDNGEYFFINGNNLSNGSIIINESTRRASEEEYLKHKKDLNDRTILVSINGTLGNIGTYQGEKVFLGKSACYLNVLPEVDKDFIRYVLTGNDFQYYIHNLATGSTIKNVGLKLMREYSFKLPDLKTQKSVSLVLGAIDSKINTNTKINQTLEQMAQVIFKSWFVDFDPVKAKMNGEQPEGMDEATASLFPEKLVESELGLIPEGWEIKPIKDLCTKVQNGGTPKRNEKSYWDDGTIPWLTSGEVRQSIITAVENRITQLGLDKSSAKWVPELSTLVALYGATAGEVSLTSIPLTTNQAVCALMPKKEHQWYNYLQLKNRVAELAGKAVGSAQQNISKGLVESTEVLSVPESLLETFNSQVENLFRLRICNLNENVELAKLRDTLLPKLLSGEIELGKTQELIEVE
ncbi:restriction endonuclease subunit S [Vibrio sp. YQ_11]|uniref:restriction endonuclease subunit S n=1 Tax=Vibrio sp. YQ_11 TaxID=3367233 RepID=UPI00370A3DC8